VIPTPFSLQSETPTFDDVSADQPVPALALPPARSSMELWNDKISRNDQREEAFLKNAKKRGLPETH